MEIENEAADDNGQDLDMREALEDAFKQADEPIETEGVASETIMPLEEEAEKPAEIEENDQKTVEKSAESAPEQEKAGEPAPKTDKAPAGWSPTAREEWGGLSDTVKQQVMKREREAQQAMDNSAQARRGMNDFNQMLEPFKQSMISSGYSNPFEAITEVLNTEATLRHGTPQDKAGMVAQLIQGYGVDIQALDSLLAGQPVQPSENATIEQLIDKRMQPVNQMLNQINQAEQQNQIRTQQAATAEVENFQANAEFLNEVRMDMADLMDMAAKRGQTMTLEQAYEKACAINPEVSAVISQRSQQQKIMGTHNTAQQKKAASVSLTGQPAGAGGGLPSNMSLRDSIAAAWNEAG